MNDQERLLLIFLRLQSGAHLSKIQLAEEYGVSPKTIQRDFALLAEVLDRQTMIAAELVYDPRNHTRHFKGRALFNKKDALFISKVLLENRALNQDENQRVLENLLQLLTKEERRAIKQVIASELLNYAPITDPQARIDKIWAWSEFIRMEQVLDIVYQSPYKDKKEMTVLPVSIFYDTRYFYVVAFHLNHENYITLKLDRISTWLPSSEKKPTIPYGKKFRDGDVRNYRVDSFIGPTIYVRVLFAYDPTIVLDQFPDAEVIANYDEGVEIEFKTQYTPGLKRWLLSQGEALKVLSPEYLAKDLEESLKRILERYREFGGGVKILALSLNEFYY